MARSLDGVLHDDLVTALLVAEGIFKSRRAPTAPSLFRSVWFSCGLLDSVDGEGVGAVVEIAAGVGDVGASCVPDRADREVAESGEISGCVTGSEL
jgi:hypothetical protein